jgi:hypothetical protein
VATLQEADASRSMRSGDSTGLARDVLQEKGQVQCGLEASDMKGLKELEQEGSRFKWMYADLSLENPVLKNVIAKSCSTR